MKLQIKDNMETKEKEKEKEKKELESKSIEIEIDYLYSRANDILSNDKISEKRKIVFLNDVFLNLDESQTSHFRMLFLDREYIFSKLIKQDAHKVLKVLCENDMLNVFKLCEHIIENLPSSSHLIEIYKDVLKNKIPARIFASYVEYKSTTEFKSLILPIKEKIEDFILSNFDLNILNASEGSFLKTFFSVEHKDKEYVELFRATLRSWLIQSNDNIESNLIKPFHEVFYNYKKDDEKKSDLLKELKLEVYSLLLKKSAIIDKKSSIDLESLIKGSKDFKVSDLEIIYKKFDNKIYHLIELIKFNDKKIEPKNKKNIGIGLKWIKEKIKEDASLISQNFCPIYTAAMLNSHIKEKFQDPIYMEIVEQLLGAITLSLKDVVDNFICKVRYDSNYDDDEKANAKTLKFIFNNFSNNKIVIPTYLKEILINEFPKEEDFIKIAFEKQELENKIQKKSLTNKLNSDFKDKFKI